MSDTQDALSTAILAVERALRDLYQGQLNCAMFELTIAAGIVEHILKDREREEREDTQ